MSTLDFYLQYEFWVIEKNICIDEMIRLSHLTKMYWLNIMCQVKAKNSLKSATFYLFHLKFFIQWSVSQNHSSIKQSYN